ncbi:hypothetical protein INT48_005816 [Thamnidium elegans]|uniref:Acetyl-CoA synthetase-like protein n=1 Tax=Thamnidium elegans TaxID=101142 RepID=A0A8H7SSA3_9FUNG|nr:hypothetical protein INT48_005816 [Thamnidium elegans]
MVFKSKLPSFVEPTTGLYQFLFPNPSNIPDERPMLFDALNPSKFLTYSQLKNYSLRFAAGLQDVCDFKDGDVLALYASSQYEYALPYLGAIAAGGVITTANPNFSLEELLEQFQQVKPKVIICQDDNIDIALAAGDLSGVERKNIFIFGDKEAQSFQPFKTALIRGRKAVVKDINFEQAKEKVAILCFSSGTTGRSKGVMTTHANMTANLIQFTSLERRYLNKKNDRILSVIPLFHIFGLTVILNTALYLGLPVYVLPRFDPVDFCETVQNCKITYIPAVPTVCLFLAKQKLVEEYNLSSLRLILCGGSPLSGDLVKEAMRKLPNLLIKQGYGLTETSPFSIIEPSEETIHGSSGILLSNMTAKLVDDDGNEIQGGNRGELWLKGPNIMKGYLNNPLATADCMDDEGYFHTGDIVVVDKDEHFYVVDRKKELIKHNGFQVPPAELEGILITYPGIADCAVIGIYDHDLATEMPRAYIALEGGMSSSPVLAADIMKFVANKVAHYKQLRSLLFVDSIPRGPAGKILRRVLRESTKEEDVKNASKL